MSGNFEWQKHQANEQVRARLQAAAAHRLAKGAGKRRRPYPFPVVALWRAFSSVAGRFWPREGPAN